MKNLFIQFVPRPFVLKKILEDAGISQRKIEKIIEVYPDVKSILEADPQELGKVAEMDVDEAKNLQILIKKRTSGNRVGNDFLKRWGRVSSNANLKSSYEEYDRLSKLYPNSPIVWEIKGEILEKMGRYAEAREVYDKAYKLYLQRGEMPPESLIEKLRRQEKKREKSIIGMGLSNGLGTINGFKNGFRNGLINGKGIVNGSSVISPRTPMKDIGKIIIPLFIAFLIIAAPLMGIIFFEKHYIFKVDGNFQEWKSEIPYYGLRSPKNSINILNVKFHPGDNGIYFYIHPQDDIFKNSTGIYIFLDTDTSSDTGYLVQGIGADYMVEIYGWNSSIVGKTLYIFNGTNQQDFSNFKSISGVNVIYKNGKIEGFVSLPYKKFRAITISYDFIGNEGVVPCPLYGEESFLVIEEKYANILKLNESNALLKIEFVGKNIEMNSLSFKFSGNANPQNIPFSLYEDNGDGIFDSHDSLISQGEIEGDNLTFKNISLKINNSTLFLVLRPDYGNLEKTVKIELLHIEANKKYFIDNRIEDGTYIGKIPSKPIIDGSFSDWKNPSTDSPQDVISSNGSMRIDAPNIDLMHFSFYNADKLYVFMDVRGRILGGTDAPTTRFPSLPDSDGDSVPDIFDPYPHDFNNDGIPDNESFVIVNGEKLPDVDGDGWADYPQGDDMWLNTTIPSWFPKPYAGRIIHRYIGPVPKKEVYGVDTVTIYINSDNNIRTGFSLPQYPMGAEYMIQLYGRDGIALNSSLFVYHSKNWVYLSTIHPFLGYHGMELNTTISSAGTSAFIFISDWKGDRDSSDNAPRYREENTKLHLSALTEDNFRIQINYTENNIQENYSLVNLRADFGTDIQITSSPNDEVRPSIARTSSGDIWVVYDNSSGYLSLAISSDNGDTWNVYYFNIKADNPVIFADSQDNIYIFYENHSINSNFTYIRIDSQGYIHPYMYVETSWWKNVYDLSIDYLSQGDGHIYLSFDYYYNSYYYLGYLHSNDSGLNWEGGLIINLTNNPGNPSTAISSGSSPQAFIAFEYYYSNTWYVVVVNSSGLDNPSWQINSYWTGNLFYGDYRHPSIFAYGDKIYLGYEAEWTLFTNDWDIKFVYSTDNGQSWSSEITVADDNNDEISPWVISDGRNVYLFYIEKTSRRRAEIIMKESSDDGQNWSDGVQIDDENRVESIYRGVSAICSGGGIYVVWTDNRNSNDDIYFDKIPEFSDFLFVIIPILIIIAIIRRREKQ